MSRSKTLLRSLIAIGAAGAAAAFGSYSAFSSTTESPDNRVVAGTVSLTDNDVDGPMYDVPTAKAGDIIQRCIKVSYTGLDATVKLYAPDVIGPLGQYLDLKIEQGTQATPSFPSCSGFAPTRDVWTGGSLAAFRTAHSSWTNGLADGHGAATKWTGGQSAVYRITLTVADDDAAKGLSTNLHRIAWEAQSQ